MSSSQPRILLPMKYLTIVVLKKTATAIFNCCKKHIKAPAEKSLLLTEDFLFFKQFSGCLRATIFDQQYLLPCEFL